MALQTPHLEKLKATLQNDKLPLTDRPRLEIAIKKYYQWIDDLRQVKGNQDEVIEKMIVLLNEYKIYIDVDLIFDSDEDFLYRQKGQLKLDNSIIEEFLPWLLNATLTTEKNVDIHVGPNKCFSSIYFTSTINNPLPDGGLQVRTKDQDFAISKRLFIQTSHDPEFVNASKQETHIAYIAAEIKTNLDKTMFQEACATAHDVKTAVSGSKYFLLCEWLDMTPINTATTDIDEVMLLRDTKRISSNIRAQYSTSTGRKKHRKDYITRLQKHPLRKEIFNRFIGHIMRIIEDENPIEDDVLKNGFF